MRKLLSLIIILGCTTLVFGQKVQWGELEKSSGKLLDILPENANKFYALRYSGGALLGRMEGSYHKNLELINDGKLELKAPNGSLAKFEAARMINGKFIVFLSDKQDDENKFFMQEYNNFMEPTGKATEIASYTLSSKLRRFQGNFSLIQSQDRSFLTVLWTIPGRKEEHTTYGYKTFDADLNQITDGEYEIPFEEKFSAIRGFNVSNSGDLFVSVVEYKKNEDKKLFKNPLDYVALHIYHMNGEEQRDMTIDLEGKRVEAMSFNSNSERIFVMTGIYGNKNEGGVKGLFYLRLDFKTGEILAEGFEEFGKDFIMSDWSDRAKKKQSKREAKGKGSEPTLYSYVTRDIHTLEDGSVVGTMEQYYVRVVTRYDSRTGTTTTTYYYYYNDIIAYKVGPDGGFDWLAKIDKYQVSTNDGGYFSSYARFVSEDKITLIFNDNIDNYDETSGEYLNADKIKSSRLSKKKNTIAICEIDLSNGNVERRTMTDRSELGAIAVPKLFNTDYINNELLLYAIKGKKEKFGILKF